LNGSSLEGRRLRAPDLLELNGKDLRSLPLGGRKAKLKTLLAGSAAGIVYNEHTDADGETVFRHACRFGFEGIVSKPAPYRSGPVTGLAEGQESG
jgi:bifunctional non-homologous end joining protein LigD